MNRAITDCDFGHSHDFGSRGPSAMVGVANTLRPAASRPEWHAHNQGHCPDPLGAFVLGVTASVAARGLIR